MKLINYMYKNCNSCYLEQQKLAFNIISNKNVIFSKSSIQKLIIIHYYKYPKTKDMHDKKLGFFTYPQNVLKGKTKNDPKWHA